MARKPRSEDQGECARTVGLHLEVLRREHALDTGGEALASVALRLAGLLDEGEPVMMTGTWARELRNTLDALNHGRSGDDSDDGWLADLPAPVRDAKKR